MLNIAAHMVIKDDAYYVPMAIQSILSNIKGLYVQDQMSTDGTYEIISEMAKDTDKIVIERVDTGFKQRFHPDYDEPKYRTMALKRCEEVFNPEWLLKCDADEVFTEYFFHRLESLLTPDFVCEAVRVSGDRPVSKDYWATLGSTIMEKSEYNPEGGRFGDPHTQLWRNGRYYYTANPTLTGSKFHPVLSPEPFPQYWLPGICNFHLHRLFGPKAFAFWQEGGEVIDRKKLFLPPRDCPEWFNSEVNMGTAEKRDFDWPEYILEKWAAWEGGIW